MDDVETEGDGNEIACPWCGETMWLADDGRYQGGLDECEHCEKPVKIDTDYTVYTTATRVEPAK